MRGQWFGPRCAYEVRGQVGIRARPTGERGSYEGAARVMPSCRWRNPGPAKSPQARAVLAHPHVSPTGGTTLSGTQQRGCCIRVLARGQRD